MIGQASLFAGVSPKYTASCACTLGVVTHCIHLYAQLGCGAFVASIHVSAQPVAPCTGIASATLAPAERRVLV